MVYQYSWKTGYYPVSAQETGEFLNKISEREGGVTAARVLDLSRREDALLHPCFEWDDTKAAESHRLYQARKLVGNLVCAVVKEDPEKEVVAPTTRAFVSVSAPQEKGIFKPTIVAMSDPVDRQIVLDNAKREALSFANKYSGLSEFAEVIEAINRAVME